MSHRSDACKTHARRMQDTCKTRARHRQDTGKAQARQARQARQAKFIQNTIKSDALIVFTTTSANYLRII
ncbi:MAG: hypothetical protein KTR32_01755 [Granulosicoccus sp.]|nr:hypothetical protein [Granulosicoccus sp.]